MEWAEVNGVEPPAFLVARVEKAGEGRYARLSALIETIDISGAVSDEAPSKSCCCCRPSCDDRDTIDVTDDPILPTAAKPALRLVFLEDAARCRGIELVWSIFAEAVVEVRSTEVPWKPPLHLFTYAIANDRAIPAQICPEPPIP